MSRNHLASLFKVGPTSSHHRCHHSLCIIPAMDDVIKLYPVIRFSNYKILTVSAQNPSIIMSTETDLPITRDILASVHCLLVPDVYVVLMWIGSDCGPYEKYGARMSIERTVTWFNCYQFINWSLLAPLFYFFIFRIVIQHRRKIKQNKKAFSLSGILCFLIQDGIVETSIGINWFYEYRQYITPYMSWN